MQFNPQMFEQAKQFMTKDNLKFASEQIKNMSDEQLKQYAQMTGQNIDPSFLRNQANMFQNVDDSQLNYMKNMNYNQYHQNASTNRSQQYIPPDNFQNPPQFQSQSSYNASDQKQTHLYPNITSLKEKGNQSFKQQKYEEASSKYLEAIMEIEEDKIKNPKKNCQELRELEVACRSNYANTKAKLNDYDTVLLQAIEILKIAENGKAYFRLGQAYHKLGNDSKALPNLEKAVKMIPNDDTIKELLQTVKDNVAKQQQEKQKQQDIEKKAEESKQPKAENLNKSQENQQQKTTEEEVKHEVKKQQKQEQQMYDSPYDQPIKKESENNNNYDSPYDIPIQTPEKKTQEFNNVHIQEEEEEVKINNNNQNIQNQQQPSGGFNPNPYANMNRKLDPTQTQAAMDQLKNMDDNQMKQMCDMMKTMDPNFLKSMMESQTGVKMSDDDLKNMQNMFSPELLKMAGQMQGGFPNGAQMPTNNNNSQQQLNTQGPNIDQTQQQPQQQQQFGGNVGAQTATAPNFSSLLQNQEMITTLMDNLSKNPEMLKSMVKMLGPNHPLASMLDRASAKDLGRLVSLIKYGIKGIGFVAKLYKFVKKHYIPVFILIAAFIYYKYKY